MCRTCGVEKDDSEFHFRNDTGKLRNECISCSRERYKRHHAANRDRLNEQCRIYHMNHLVEAKLYRETHKEDMIRNEKNRARFKYNQFRMGKLNPYSTSGQAVVTEHVVYTVLGDCVKCNNRDKFTSSVDLVSESLGEIDVKSSSLLKHRCHGNIRFEWNFHLHLNHKHPDYYVCIGFDDSKCNIEHVWIIPSDSEKVGAFAINICNSDAGLKSVQKYEVDSCKYNEVYRGLNIHDLPEFANLDVDVV